MRYKKTLHPADLASLEVKFGFILFNETELETKLSIEWASESPLWEYCCCKC